ncbi:hypothetical protein BKA82DRAFT_4342719 [Pisolithus tinctorius]|nr:hypothetical protein BKA82DRAFT_4342719 [Pisolithus tinctorius]
MVLGEQKLLPDVNLRVNYGTDLTWGANARKPGELISNSSSYITTNIATTPCGLETPGIWETLRVVKSEWSSRKYVCISESKVLRAVHAREIVARALSKIADYFGADVILLDGSLDHKKLGSIVFNGEINGRS